VRIGRLAQLVGEVTQRYETLAESDSQVLVSTRALLWDKIITAPPSLPLEGAEVSEVHSEF
jgi:hypothetical protein